MPPLSGEEKQHSDVDVDVDVGIGIGIDNDYANSIGARSNLSSPSQRKSTVYTNNRRRRMNGKQIQPLQCEGNKNKNNKNKNKNNENKNKKTSMMLLSCGRSSAAVGAVLPPESMPSPLASKDALKLSAMSETTTGAPGQPKDQLQHQEQQQQYEEDDDPVMALLQAQSSQRVRFCLVQDHHQQQQPAANPNPNTNTTNSTDCVPASPSISSSPSRYQKYSTESTKPAAASKPAATTTNNSVKASMMISGIKTFMNRSIFRRNIVADDSTKQPDDGAGVLNDEEKKLLNHHHHPLPTTHKTIANTPSSPTPPSLSEEQMIEIHSEIIKCINKARRAHHVRYRYKYALKCSAKAHELLFQYRFSYTHPLFLKNKQQYEQTHQAIQSLSHSSKIIQMGLKAEQSGQWIKALKMYTIAYRIRRDQVSKTHPSLLVLLNILGSIQRIRGEYTEAQRIFEFAMQGEQQYGGNDGGGNTEENSSLPSQCMSNLLARATTYRELAMLYELEGDSDKALEFFHASLSTIEQWKLDQQHQPIKRGRKSNNMKRTTISENRIKNLQQQRNDMASMSSCSSTVTSTSSRSLCSLDDLQVSHQASHRNGMDGSVEEMEIFISSPSSSLISCVSGDVLTMEYYNSLFPSTSTSTSDSDADADADAISGGARQPQQQCLPKLSALERYADVDLSLTLHLIGQLHKRQGQYNKALDAYRISAKGMRYALGNNHPNVAAILGNIGNLLRLMGDCDGAYDTYQEVLGIESKRLGVAHPEVAVSLHNVAMIQADRQNYEQALNIYDKVLALQKKLFGENHIAVATTAAAMGDVYERNDNLEKSLQYFEEAMKIKSKVLRHHDLQVARLMHKLGKTLSRMGDFDAARSYTNRVLLIYKINSLKDDHEWVIDVYRDQADIDAAIATGFGKKSHF